MMDVCLYLWSALLDAHESPQGQAYLVGKSRHYATLYLLAVPGKVKIAILWWAILCIYAKSDVLSILEIGQETLADEVPSFGPVLALPNAISPDGCIADVEGLRGFDEIFHKLSCIFCEVVLCEIANCAMTQTAPASHVAGKREERERIE